MEMWAKLPVTAVAANGNVTQLYPTWAPVGDPGPPFAYGNTVRKPTDGALDFVQVETDNVNGGRIELWDVNGADIGANVSSLTVITNAQLVALQALGKAKLIYSQEYAPAAGAWLPTMNIDVNFQHGLAARFISGAGTCYLNLAVEGGFCLNGSAGS